MHNVKVKMMRLVTIPDPSQKECRYCNYLKTLNSFYAYCPIFDKRQEERVVDARAYIVRLQECINAAKGG